MNTTAAIDRAFATAKCIECSDIVPVAEIANGQCMECRYIDCEGERQDFVTWACFCNQHGTVR
jgi:hypothetical protein